MDARTLLDEGDLPHLFDGRAELQKPPLYYWLVAAAARLRGGVVDAWAVRLPAAAAALLCVLAVAAGLGRGCGRRAAGLLAAVVLASAAHFTWLARIGRIDMPLALTVTLAAGAAYLARRSPPTPALPHKGGGRKTARLPLLVLAYLAVAAGVLLKGPIGLVLPAAVIAAHLAVEHGLPRPGRWRAWFRSLNDLGVWWGLPLAAALAVPWFLWADARTGGEFTHVFFWHHNVERGWGGSGLRSNPWWFYPPQFAVDFLPWSLLLPPAAWWAWRHRLWREDAEARFGLTWFLTVLLLMSLARFKRADYLLPAYPGAAVFLGCVGGHWLRHSAWGGRRGAALVAALAGAMVVVWLVRVEWLLPAREPYRDYRAFAAHVRRLAPPPAEVVFFRTEAHALAFHVGRPLAVVVQWGELRERLTRPGEHYVVMPPDSAAESGPLLPGVRLETVLHNTDLSGGEHERPLVLLRAAP
jgi:4-amino-4-deoxy-L-arabinose transferase-like glycosyltransferase